MIDLSRTRKSEPPQSTLETMGLEVVCPVCHRFFSREVEGAEFVSRELADVPVEPGLGPRSGSWTPTFARREYVRYRYRYKCKHCGHEWSEIKTEEHNA